MSSPRCSFRCGVGWMELPRLRTPQHRPYPGVCLAALNDTGNGDGGGCYALSQIKAGHTLTGGAPGGIPVVYGLAPEGVHSVTFTPTAAVLDARSLV